MDWEIKQKILCLYFYSNIVIFIDRNFNISIFRKKDRFLDLYINRSSNVNVCIDIYLKIDRNLFLGLFGLFSK